MRRFPFFDEHPDYRYAVLDWHIQHKLHPLQNFYMHSSPVALQNFVEKEFSGDDAVFKAYIFNMLNIQRLQLMQLQAELRKFQQQ